VVGGLIIGTIASYVAGLLSVLECIREYLVNIGVRKASSVAV